MVVSGGGGANAPWWPRGPAPTPRRSSSQPRIRVSWPLVRSVESCQTCSRLTIVTSRSPWRRLQHAPSPVWGAKAGGRHTARTMYDPWPLPTGRTPTTTRFYRVSAGVAHPTTTLHHPPWRPTKPPSARLTRRKLDCDKYSKFYMHENPSNALSHGPGGPQTLRL